MTILRNNFEGGPTSTIITAANSNQTGTQNAFNVVSSGTGLLPTYFALADIANCPPRPTAEFFCAIITNSSQTVTPYVMWTTASMGAQSQTWMRFYFNVGNPLTVSTPDQPVLAILGSGSQGVGVWIRTDTTNYVYQIRELGATGTMRDDSSLVYTLNEWIRLEFHCTFSTVRGTSSSELYLYAGDNVDTNNYTELVTQTGADYGVATQTNWVLGQGWILKNSTPNLLYTNWECNNTGFPGPAPFRAGKGVPGILTNPVAIHSDIS